MRLSVNLASLNIYNEQTKNLKLQSTAMSRISTGVKVNNSADDPYAIAQREKFRMQIRGMQMSQKNVQDGVSMLQTTEGALNEATSMLQRIRELTVQAGGINTTDDKAIIQGEISQMIKGIDDIMNNTEFNGVKLLNDSTVTDNDTPSSLIMSVGANSDELTKIPKYNLTSGMLGDAAASKFINSIDVTQATGVDDGLDIIDKALSTITGVNSKYGALENRFQSTYDRDDAIGESLQTAESGVSDADVAEEMMNYSRSSILIEAGTALMVQTNKFPQDALRILDNVR